VVVVDTDSDAVEESVTDRVTVSEAETVCVSLAERDSERDAVSVLVVEYVALAVSEDELLVEYVREEVPVSVMLPDNVRVDDHDAVSVRERDKRVFDSEYEIVAVADGVLDAVAVLVVDGVGGGVTVSETLALVDVLTVAVRDPVREEVKDAVAELEPEAVAELLPLKVAVAD
jgi:hypothetical protein